MTKVFGEATTFLSGMGYFGTYYFTWTPLYSPFALTRVINELLGLVKKGNSFIFIYLANFAMFNIICLFCIFFLIFFKYEI